MKRKPVENLEEILEKHRRWLEEKTDTGAERADLEGCNLQERIIRNADLRFATFQGGWLPDAEIYDTTAMKANFKGAFMHCVNMHNVDLRGAILEDVDLWGSNLINVDLRGANLRNAKLGDTYQCNVNMEGAITDGMEMSCRAEDDVYG
jgi:uncharacterized protein YjbI with pentapeptide repeats